MSNVNKVILNPDDIPKLKKYGFLKVGKNLLIYDRSPFKINQVRLFGNPEVCKYKL